MAYTKFASTFDNKAEAGKGALLSIHGQDQLEVQIPVSYCNAEEALDMYRQRWQIETFFRDEKHHDGLSDCQQPTSQ